MIVPSEIVEFEEEYAQGDTKDGVLNPIFCISSINFFLGIGSLINPIPKNIISLLEKISCKEPFNKGIFGYEEVDSLGSFMPEIKKSL